ncbi:rhamnulokinase family protein [Rugosimonospora acidiphila]|uniref:Rhamnulokinase family protein n=1 Tax=Rugosimonospora acidiphila TaxID=556531 RepID=A0ABP9S5M8_9ACTN
MTTADEHEARPARDSGPAVAGRKAARPGPAKASVSRRYAAVDLGAASGRVMIGEVGAGRLELTEAHRFPNEPVRLPDGLHWDILRLYRELLAGLRHCGDGLASVGIDSWAVDYGLLDERGALLGLPYHYRDPRTEAVAVPDPERYAVTGTQHLPINTIYQLLAEPPSRLAAARRLLLVPDLLGYWLTGQTGAERTNASTTGLFDARAGRWAGSLIDRLGLRPELFPELREPGSAIGTLLPHTGLDLPLVAVASHDTASAVVAVPASVPNFAYISTGTWSLVGVELPAPVLSPDSRDANFTNELGVDNTIRYLRNVMGLWLLQECQRGWHEPDTGALLAAAASAAPFGSLIDPDDPSFLAPGDMPSRIDAYCARTDQPTPAGRPGYVRCIMESLALGHRAALRAAARLSGRTVEVVHLIGGGARNDLLCQLTADACGLPVVAGPIEATALGNVLIQARADGGPADLPAMRGLVAATQPLRHFEPRGDSGAWDKAAARIGRE